MQFQKILTLAGPNIWSRHPMLEAWVDLQELKDTHSASVPGFTDRLMAWLPSLIEHRCSVGERGGFLQRLKDGTWPGHILEHVTLELQTLAGTPVGFGKARETSVPGVYKVAVRYREERLGRAALHTARELVLAAIYDRPFDVKGELRKLADIADRYYLGPSTLAIVKAAEARNIPSRRLNDGSLVQLGQGKRQRRIWTAETDRTSAIAGAIAQDKELTKRLLREVGVPVPDGRVVESADDAWEAAAELGIPVVVKPRDANHGRGVFVDLKTRAQVVRAYEAARKEGSGVIVETFAPGAEHRLLVVGTKLVAAARGDAAYVIGDGTHTVADLVEAQLNTDPRRGVDESSPLCLVTFIPGVLVELEQQGHSQVSVPKAGERVLVQRSDNLALDVTSTVHPSTAAHTVMAARVIGLDIAGIDLVCEDITRPLEEQGGRIVEVNAGPGLLMHLRPSIGEPRPVGETIVGELFAPGENGRIPIACVTGTNGKSTVSRLLAHLLRSGGGEVVGLASSDGIVIGAQEISQGDCAGPRSARRILAHPDVSAAVLEAGRGGILREGLGFDQCDVAVVTNVGEGDHLGQSDIHTKEQLLLVKRAAVDVVLPGGAKVLNADDPICRQMAGLGRGETIFFTLDEANPTFVEHRRAGGRVAFLRGDGLMVGSGDTETRVAALKDVPITWSGRVSFQVENVLAALAAATALNVSLERCREGLASFRGDLDDAPGRFNVLSARGGTLILDDAHNCSGLLALIAALDHFPGARRVIAYSAGGGRRDSDIVRQGEILGSAFDRVVLYHDPADTERTAEALFALFREGLKGAVRAKEIVDISNPYAARQAALEALDPACLVVIQAEDQNPGPAVSDVRAITFNSFASVPASEPQPAHRGERADT